MAQSNRQEVGGHKGWGGRKQRSEMGRCRKAQTWVEVRRDSAGLRSH